MGIYPNDSWKRARFYGEILDLIFFLDRACRGKNDTTECECPI